ncbi:hypothetical protein AYO21_07520 [Fonsecaea monophora]|uniref:ABC transporter domain-containing protein n=1 Tax=Fonsecaea monophora TaxID=254056 RepID=A0A177F1U1_9EURO|nr:hypothetical protein AYO21_07520 [Fonsecaea monophora]OAG38294.1 hypothetical protein AYO21_07520 [Fonsecaea monophora]
MAVLSQSWVYIPRLVCAITVYLLTFGGPSFYRRFLPSGPKLAPARRLFFLVALACQVLLYTVDAVALVALSMSNEELPGTLPAFSEAFLLLATVAQLAQFFDAAESPPWLLHVGNWVLLCAAEVLAFIVLEVDSGGRCAIRFPCGLGLLLVAAKTFVWLAAGAVFLLQWLRDGYEKLPTVEVATEHPTDPSDETNDEEKDPKDVLGIRRPATEEIEEIGWIAFVKRHHIFLPFVWPSDQPWMIFRFVACFVIVVGESIMKYYVPVLFSNFMDSLDSGSSVWTKFWLLRLLSWLVSTAGLALPREIMSIDVRQYRFLKLSNKAHEKIMNLDSFFHSVVSSGDKIQAVDSSRPMTLIIDALCFEMLPLTVKFCFASITLHLDYGPRMTLIIVCMTIVLALMEIKCFPRLTKKFDESHVTSFKANQRRHDDIKGHSTVANHNQIEPETTAFGMEQEEYVDQYNGYARSFYYLQGANGLVIEVFEVIAQGLVTHQIRQGRAKVASMNAFVGLWPFVYEPSLFFAREIESKMEALINTTRLRRMWEISPTVEGGTEELKCPDGEVEFKDLGFSYPGSDLKVFDGLNLKIPAGKRVGIVGESGSGKTSLVRLLMRKYRPELGSVLIDGQNINDVTRDSIHRKVAVMDQSPFLFNRTIKENVKFARPDATDEEVIEACKRARIHEVIMKRKDGYDTLMGEEGSHFSGGQGQRVCMARIFLADPSIVLVDEATSALDLHIEAEIQANFKENFPRQTMVFITHRVATVRFLDLIIVLGPGGVKVEQGTHDELLERKGRYWELCNLNMGLPARHDDPDSGEGSAGTESPVLMEPPETETTM